MTTTIESNHKSAITTIYAKETNDMPWFWALREKLSFQNYQKKPKLTIEQIKKIHDNEIYPITTFYLPYDVTVEEQKAIEKILKSKNLPFNYKIEKEEDIPRKGTHRILDSTGEFGDSDIVNQLTLEITKEIFNFDIMAYIQEDNSYIETLAKEMTSLS